jgi:hypothetical protein
VSSVQAAGLLPARAPALAPPARDKDRFVISRASLALAVPAIIAKAREPSSKTLARNAAVRVGCIVNELWSSKSQRESITVSECDWVAKGEAGVHGGPSGDLDVVFFVKEHEIFERQQNNIYCTIPISIAQAALGAEVTIPTLEGEDKLKIPEGTQSGKIFSLRGKGIASPTGKGRGDQYVRVNVTIPTKLTREQRKLLEQFAEVSDISNKPLERKILDKVKDIFG